MKTDPKPALRALAVIGFLIGGLSIGGLLIGPVGVSYAQEALPTEIQTTLAEAAAQSDEALLEAVATAVKQNPDLAQAIVEEAARLKPALSEAIIAAATDAGGAVAIAPAAGPAAFPVAAAIGGAGAGGAGAVAAGGGGGGGGGDGGGDGGGGGGGGGGAVPGPPESFETPEYNAQEGLGLVKASDAYARALTGQGVIVAVLDTGLDVTHPEFADRIAPGGYDFVLGTPDMTDPNSHGTHVSGIIGARKDDVGMHGVAYNAQILPIKIGNAAGSIPLDDAGLAEAIDHAVANGAAVLNNSWGSSTSVTAVTPAYLSAVIPLELAAYRDAVAGGAIVVFAAGNDDSAEPSVRSGLPYHFPELQNLWVAVMAVDLNGGEAWYTNYCGVAAAWCIAAPGGGAGLGPGVNSTVPGGGYGRKSGTSMAAPHVSGALAVILELFDGLTPEEAAERLFVSADSSGVYADSSIFGHGLLDLEAATRPIGTVFVLTGDRLGGPAFALKTTRISLGSAFGDGLRSSLAGAKLTVFDSYDAPFRIDLGQFVQPDSGRLDLRSLLARFGQDRQRQTVAYGDAELSYALNGSNQPADDATSSGRALKTAVEEVSFTQRFADASELTFNYNIHPALGFGLHAGGTVDRTTMVSADAFAVPYLSFGERGYNFNAVTALGSGTLRLGSFFGESVDEGAGETFGGLAEFAVGSDERANLALQLGMMNERETFLGSRTEGAFDIEDDVPTYFGGLSGRLALGDSWKLLASTYAGLSYPKAADGSMFADVSPILTQSFSLGLIGDGVLRDGDRLGLVVNQPLRVTRGSAELTLATRRDRSGKVFSQTVTADLAPEGREIDVEAFYSMSMAEHTRLTTSAMLRSQPGHIERASPEAIFMLRFEHRF